MRTLLPLALFLVPLGGCQQYLFDQVCPAGIAEVDRTIPALAPAPADILFVIDNSGSMADEQENLALNFGAFIDVLASGAGDYHIAVATTDVGVGGDGCGRRSECEGLAVQNRLSEFPFALQNTDQSACMDSDIPFNCFIGSESGGFIRTATTEPETVVQQFGANVRIGSCGSGVERGLEAMREALAFVGGEGCNQGFIRPEANLIVVFVSDEPDFSGDDPIDYLDDLAFAKGGDFSKVRVAAIVGAIEGEASVCRADETGAATASCGALVCDAPPDPGSRDGCNNDGDCSNGEVCRNPGGGQTRCINPAAEPLLQAPNDDLRCGDCTFYATEDCCSARPGFGYVEFAERAGARASGSAQDRIDCRVQSGQQTFCVVDAICQTNFSETLATIARELVLSENFALDPPAENPEGVTARITGANGVVRELVNGVDFRIEDEGRSIRFLGGAAPGELESLSVAYVTERESPASLRGACATSTSAAP
ncbi:MAG: vWA domain-containing protein [Myxococcota bacterium]